MKNYRWTIYRVKIKNLIKNKKKSKNLNLLIKNYKWMILR